MASLWPWQPLASPWPFGSGWVKQGGGEGWVGGVEGPGPGAGVALQNKQHLNRIQCRSATGLTSALAWLLELWALEVISAGMQACKSKPRRKIPCANNLCSWPNPACATQCFILVLAKSLAFWHPERRYVCTKLSLQNSVYFLSSAAASL